MSNSLTLVKFRKLIASISLTALVASLLVVPTVTQAQAHWADNAYAALGDMTQDARYGDSMNKCEFSAMLTRAFDLEEEVVENDFTDVPGWCEPYVGAMLANNVAEGRNSTEFGAADDMPRGEAFKMVANALGLEDAELPAGHDSEFVGMEWAMGATGALYNEGVVTGDGDTGNFRPFDSMNRAEGFVLAWRAGGEPEAPEQPVVDGDLMVSLSSDTPEAKSVPRNGFEIPYTTVRLSAEDSDANVSVSQLVVSRTGLGSVSDFSKVKLYVGDNQVGSEKTLSTSSNTATFLFTSGDLVIPKGGFVDLEIRGDMAGGEIQGSEHRLGIASSSDVVTSGGEVGGSFPVFGETMTLANVSVGSLTIDHTDVTGDLEVGTTDEVLGRVQLQAGSQEDLSIRMLRYKQTGSADGDDLANLTLYHGATVVAEDPTWEGDYAVFDMSDDLLSLDKGDDVNLVLRGDVVGGINNTVGFEVKDAKDVVAHGDVLGFRANVTEDPTYTITNRNIIGGDLNFSLAADNPPSQEVGIGSENVEFMRFNVTTAGDSVLIEDFDLELDPTNATASQLTDIKVSMVNEDGTVGSTVAGPVDGTDTDAGVDEVIDFTDDWEVPAQTTQTYVVTADVATDVEADETFVFIIDVSGINAEYVSTGDTVADADITPAADITGSTMTVSAPTLTVTLASTPQSKTVVKNSNDVQVAGFNFQANTVNDLLVTSVTLTQYDGDTGGDDEDVSQIRLYERMADGSLVSLTSAKSLTNGTVTFSSVNHTVEAGETAKVVAVANIPSSAANGADFGLGIAAGDITAQDEKGRTSTVPATPAGNVNDTPTVEVTVAGSGSITAALDGDTPSSSVVSTNTDNNHATSIRFSAEDEAFEVSKMRFTVGADAADSVESLTLSYTNEDGEVVTANSGIDLATGNADFSLSVGTGVYVPADGDATVEVLANLNSESNGADSGDVLGIDLVHNANFEAKGLGSNTLDTGLVATIQGNHHTVYASELLVSVAADTPTSSSVTEGSDQEVFKFNLTARGENTPSLMAAALTVSGTAQLDIANANGSASLLDANGDTEAVEAYVAAGVSAGDTSDAGTIAFAAAASYNGIPVGANVLIYDASATTYYSRTVETAPSTGELTFTPDITDYDDAIADTLTYMPLQPGSGKLHFGSANFLADDLADEAVTVTLASTAGLALGDSITVRGATDAGVVIQCTMETITNLTATVVTAGAADCTDDLDIVFDYAQTAVAYASDDNNFINEEISGTEKFTVKGDLTGATPDSGTKTVQLRINQGSDLAWNDDWSDEGDNLDDADENTSFLIKDDNLNKEEEGYSNFPQSGNALSFEG